MDATWRLGSSAKNGGFAMNLRNVLAAATAFVCLAGGASVAQADADSACTEGGMCKVDETIPPNFALGRVDGGAVVRFKWWVVVAFTGTSSDPALYEIAVCGAKSITEGMFDSKGNVKDTKVIAPKGKLSGCDNYELRTTRGVDGLVIEPKGKSFKFYAKRNGKASGFNIYLSDKVVPAREGAFHFKID
jgi:hypothetical protein